MTFTAQQREHLRRLTLRDRRSSLLPDVQGLDDEELLMVALIVAYRQGMSPEAIGPLFVDKWGINKTVVMAGLIDVIESWERVHGNE